MQTESKYVRYARENPEKVAEKTLRFHWRQTARRFLLIQERGGMCVDCGESNPLVLQFDHRDPTTKTSIVNRFHALDRKREEAYKCDIRCANCHQLKTYYARESRRGDL